MGEACFRLRLSYAVRESTNAFATSEARVHPVNGFVHRPYELYAFFMGLVIVVLKCDGFSDEDFRIP